MFPVVEETVLLETLCNSENNVHKATETLMTMGFLKKDSFPYKHSIKKNEEESYSSEKDLKNDCIFISLHDPSPKIKTIEEKAIVKKKFEEKFPKIAERIIMLALETAEYDEERAEQFLNATLSEEKKSSNENYDLIIKEKENQTIDDADGIKIEDKSFRDSGIWEKVSPDSLEDKTTATPSSIEQTDLLPMSEEKNMQNRLDTRTTQQVTPITPVVENPPLAHNGLTNLTRSKTGVKLCARIIPKGPNKCLLGSRYTAKGPNTNLAKGPKVLAKKNYNKTACTQSSNKDIPNGQCAIF